MRQAFPTRPDLRFLSRLEGNRTQRCRASSTLVAGRSTCRMRMRGLGRPPRQPARAVAHLMPYPVLTKIVPDLLLAAMAKQGDPDPPLPDHPSPGAC